LNGPGSGSPAARSDLVAAGGACLAIVVVVVVVVAVPSVQEADFSDNEVGTVLAADDGRAGLAAEDEADLTAEDEAGLAAEDEAGLAAEDEAGLAAEVEADLAAEDEAGLAAEDKAGLATDTADADLGAGTDDASLTPDDGTVLATDLLGAGLVTVAFGAVLPGVSTSTNAFVLAMALRAACVVALAFWVVGTVRGRLGEGARGGELRLLGTGGLWTSG
jgi:hypothetical protein